MTRSRLGRTQPDGAYDRAVRKFRRTLLVLVSLAVLALVLYLSRERLKRAFIAASIFRTHIMMPPSTLAGSSPAHRLKESAQFYWDFAEIPMARAKRLKQLDPILKPLVREISKQEAGGDDMQIPLHTYREIRWRENFTPDLAATQIRIQALQRSLTNSNPGRLGSSDQQDADGSWARGIDVWYLKLYYSVDKLEACRGTPLHPLLYLNPVDSPDKLTAKLEADLHDDFTKTGVFNREELDETFSALARMLFASSPTDCYRFAPESEAALRNFVNGWQNPETGYWGQWLVDRDGGVWKMDDMAITFHVVSDLHGQVSHLDRIAKRTLQLDGVNFPAGIRFDGHYENHLNWDVVKILRLAWPTLDDSTREQARAELSRMLEWCLHDSYQPEGSFKVSDLDDTAGDAYEYGVDFLVEIGYFDPEARFWTTQTFPDAERVHQQIQSKLLQIGLADPKMSGVYQVLMRGTTADAK